MHWRWSLFLALILAVATAGCSVRRFAVNRVGDALASGGSTYESDDDLQLVESALPFGLKLIESLLAESPKHKGLLLAATQGFASYSYLFVQQEADRKAAEDLEAAEKIRTRARRLYMRAHRYGFRALELVRPGFSQALTADPKAALASIRKKSDVPLLYWNAVALGLAISVSKSDASMLARLPEVEAMVDRALELDESWSDGTLHEFDVIFASGKPGKTDFDRIEKHFSRAVELSKGTRAGIYVAYAEAVSVPKQDRASFQAMLQKALAIDPEQYEASRLTNQVAHDRAEWMLERVDELILPLENPGEEKK